jgi:hypothetical protein
MDEHSEIQGDIGLSNLLKEKPCEYLLKCFNSESFGQDCINYALCPYYKRYQVYNRVSVGGKERESKKIVHWFGDLQSIKLKMFSAYSLFSKYRRLWR